MSKPYVFKILIYILPALLVTVVVWLALPSRSTKNEMSPSEAISAIQKEHPALRSYPNDNLPPQSIQTEQTADGWFVAFVQEGSGVPLIGARCFFVDKNGSVLTRGEFHATPEDLDFSIRTCSK